MLRRIDLARARTPTPSPLALSLAVTLALAASACGDPAPRGTPSPGIDFTVKGVPYHLGTGTVERSGALLKLYLSDQPDTCFAVSFTPVGRMSLLEIDVAPPASGPNVATVAGGGVATVPAPGQAVATLRTSVQGTILSSIDAAGGTISWTVNADRSLTIDTLDLTFAGTTDGLAAASQTIPPCPP